MKVMGNIAVAFTLFMAVMLLVFINTGSKYHYAKRDIVYYNDQLYRIGEDYRNGAGEEELEEKYGCSVILSKELDDPELAELYGSYAFVLDFAPEGEYIGKLAWKDELDRFDEAKNAFFHTALRMWGGVLAGGWLLLLSLYLFFVRPVRELNAFSKEIAKGNLDVKLPMHRFNLFGSFTEAFDLMREELKSSRKREIEAEITRKELIASLSHDIKTPLSVIKATCEVMDLKLDAIKETAGGKELPGVSEDVREASELTAQIAAKADTIGSLMNEVMHANLEELERIEVNAVEENSALIEEFIRNLVGYGNIVLKDHVPSCLVYMDRLRMEQVIDNVVGNSHKYAGTDIEVSFEMMENILMEDGKEGSFLCVRISDSGPGVGEDDLPLIAEKYYRGKNAKDSNGFGLGMYLVRCYMNKMGGGMEYYNDNGFVVELMIRKV